MGTHVTRYVLLLRNLDLALVDPLNHIVRVLLLHGAADALGGTEDLLDDTSEVLGERLVCLLYTSPSPRDRG